MQSPETFRLQAASLRDGEGLPRFVEQEFQDFLRCGWLAGGFARFRCDDCALDRLVPFSCKSRAVCPSCGGRRMAERAAHLIDHVFPDVPVSQWVLSQAPQDETIAKALPCTAVAVRAHSPEVSVREPETSTRSRLRGSKLCDGVAVSPDEVLRRLKVTELLGA